MSDSPWKQYIRQKTLLPAFQPDDALQDLSGILNHFGQDDTWEEQRLFQQLLTQWVTIVGDSVAAHTRPTGIHRRVLQVAASSPVWAQNLSYERRRILQKIQALGQLRSLQLKDIRFSTAEWHNTPTNPNKRLDTFQQQMLWQQHPSRLPSDPSGSAAAPAIQPQANPVPANPAQSTQAPASRPPANRPKLKNSLSSRPSQPSPSQSNPPPPPPTTQQAPNQPIPRPSERPHSPSARSENRNKPSREAPLDPSFEHWEQRRRRQNEMLPLCPSCQCPTPQGELQRWSVCAFCATQQWQADKIENQRKG